MASAGLRREKYLLTLGIVRVLDERHDLPRPGPILQMVASNLRNRPLSIADNDALCDSIFSLYHDLVTGSREYPMHEVKGFARARLITTPFGHRDLRENTPSPLMEAPAGVMVPPAGSNPPPPNMKTPVLPEKMDLATLMAERDNHIINMKFVDRSFIRVISTVYGSDGTELPNRWRVTDYSKDGHILMSVLCRFLRNSATYAGAPSQEKRKAPEDESSSGGSSQPPPKKRFRL